MILRILASIPLLGAVVFMIGWLSWMTTTCFRGRLRCAKAKEKIASDIWSIGLFLTLLYWVTFLPSSICPLVAISGVPEWLPVPLGSCGDFVVGESGDVYVDSKIVGRVVRFNRAGEFVASYGYPSGPSNSTHLSISADGVLYFAAREKLFLCDNELNSLQEYSTPTASRIWLLTRSGPVEISKAQGKKVPNGPVAIGQLLFAEKTRSSFDCSDFGQVTKTRNGLVRFDSDGTATSAYRSPLLFVPFSYALGTRWFEVLALSAIALSLLMHRHCETRKRDSDVTSGTAKSKKEFVQQP